MPAEPVSPFQRSAQDANAAKTIGPKPTPTAPRAPSPRQNPTPPPAFPTEPIRTAEDMDPTAQYANGGDSDDAPGMGGTPWGSPNFEAEGDDYRFDMSGFDPTKARKDHIGKGRWLGYISGLDRKRSKAGNPMWVFSVTVYTGEWAGRTNLVHCTLTETAMWKTGQVLTAIGWDWESNRQPSYAEVRDYALRRMVTMEVIDGEPYQGRPQTSLESLFVPTEFGYEPGDVLPDPATP